MAISKLDIRILLQCIINSSNVIVATKYGQLMKPNDTKSLDEAETKSESESRNERELFKIASLSLAIGFGCGVGSLQSLHWGPSGLFFKVSFGTFVAFAIGAAVGMLYWRSATSSVASARKSSLWLLLGGVCLFFYPLRFVPADKLPDILIGLSLAVAALSTVAFMLWQVKRFLDSDTRDFEKSKAETKHPI
jgi:hypothetical protein